MSTASCIPTRVVLMLIGFFTFLVALVIKSLAGFGAKSGIFRQSPEAVTLKYMTPITPAQWAFYTWDFLYFWLFAMFLYFLFGLWRRSAFDWMYSSPAVLPYGFHISIIISACLNIIWLFLFDKELLLQVLITSTVMMLTAHMILFFSCQGLKVYGAWLSKYHSEDLWIFRILVQNGLAVYATWASLSTVLNLTIYLQHQEETPRCECARLSLLLLLMKLLVWFVLENFLLDEHVRYIVTIYPVVILWLAATLSNSDSSESQTYIFAAVILTVSCLLLVIRTVLVSWKHKKRPLYTEISLSPVEIALTQKKIFL